MKNHLLIGLGGTGGRVLCALRKRIYNERRSNDIPGLGLSYLYIDSSGELMNPSDPRWKTLGTSVQLPPASQLRVSGANLRETLDDIKSYRGIKPWIGSPELWSKVPRSVVTSGAGGQRRRLGRFLFANMAKEFRNRLAKQYLLMNEKSGEAGVNYHVITGLAGGTGGGALVDVLAQISNFSTNQDDHLMLYAVLPEKVPKPAWDAGNYHANGYAALLELNGIMVGKYSPWDVVEASGPVSVGDIFKRAYLITNENAKGQTVDVEDELPPIIADFLYERIVESTEAQPPTLTLENFDAGPECVPGTEEPVRARKFASFGVKRVAVPEEEITEYLTTSFARQAVLQLQYNNWNDTLGFRDELPARNYDQIVAEKDAQVRWLLSNEHLMQILPILDHDVALAKSKGWAQSIETEWMNFGAMVAPMCADQPREEKLNELQTSFEEYYGRNYRGEGVDGFYEIRGRARQQLVRHICSGIEQELFGKWRDGTYAAREIGNLLAALRSELEERRQSFERWRADINDDLQVFEDEQMDVRQEWAAQNLVMFGFRWKGLFDRYVNACIGLYRSRTEAVAYDFAMSLIPPLMNELSRLDSAVAAITSRLDSALDEFHKILNARLAENEALDFRSNLVKYYDPRQVKGIVERLTTNKGEQRRQSDAVRRALMDEQHLGDQPSFERLYERVAGIDLLDVLNRTCSEQARSAHDRLIENQRERILGVSLISRLRDAHGGGDEALGELARNIIGQATTFARFDQRERAMDPGAAGAPAVGGGDQSVMAVKRPCPHELKDFVERLDATFRDTDDDIQSMSDNHGRPHELSVISIVSNFPCRYLEILKLLKEKYQDLIDSDGAGPLAKLELYTDDEVEGLPDLYSEGGTPKLGLTYLMLGEQLGVITEEDDPRTGARIVVARKNVPDGFPEQVLELGSAMNEAIEHLDHKGFLWIKEEVDRILARDYEHVDKRRELLDRLRQRVEEVRSSSRGGDHDPVYHRYLDAARASLRIIGLE